MNKHILRELAKIGVGLFLADIIGALSLSSAGLLPIALFGVTWSAGVVLPGILIDIVLILILAHYGWSMKLPIASPTERTLLMVVGTAFLIVALLHLLRIAFGWNLILGEATIPLWLSWFGVIIPGYLSYSSFHFALHKKG